MECVRFCFRGVPAGELRAWMRRLWMRASRPRAGSVCCPHGGGGAERRGGKGGQGGPLPPEPARSWLRRQGRALVWRSVDVSMRACGRL